MIAVDRVTADGIGVVVVSGLDPIMVGVRGSMVLFNGRPIGLIADRLFDEHHWSTLGRLADHRSGPYRPVGGTEASRQGALDSLMREHYCTFVA